MQTDKELLELAAKAYWLKVYESTDGSMQNRPILVFIAGGGMGTMPYEEKWNPLIEDDQLHRLQVALKIDLVWDCVDEVWEAYKLHSFLAVAYSDPDPKRAVLLVAAAIGEKMT